MCVCTRHVTRPVSNLTKCKSFSCNYYWMIWWYDMIWYDTIGYDKIRYDTIWYDMIGNEEEEFLKYSIENPDSNIILHLSQNPFTYLASLSSPYTYTYFWWTKKCRTLNLLIYTCHQGPSGLCGMDGTWANGYVSKYISWLELYSLPRFFFHQIYNL